MSMGIYGRLNWSWDLLAYPGVEPLLDEMARRHYAVNFSQTLDIACLTSDRYALLRVPEQFFDMDLDRVIRP